jgi:hypothetical protein
MALELIKLDAEGNHLAADAADWVAVFLPQHGLTFTASPVLDRNVPHAKCEAACKAVALFGAEWDLPTIDELSLLIDRSRYSPAINTDFFRDIPNDWFWSKTETAWSSGSAWGVSFGGGNVNLSRRYYDGFALAVRRAGQ